MSEPKVNDGKTAGKPNDNVPLPLRPLIVDTNTAAKMLDQSAGSMRRYAERHHRCEGDELVVDLPLGIQGRKVLGLRKWFWVFPPGWRSPAGAP